MDRRDFVRTISGVAAATGCGTILAACAGLPYVMGTPTSGGTAVPVDSMEGLDFALVEITGSSEPVLLSHSEEGRWQAVSTRCTHRGCGVRPSGMELSCPCHGSRFEFGGTLLEGPASSDLKRYGVEESLEFITILETGT